MPTKAGTDAKSREAETPAGYFVHMAGTQALEPASAAARLRSRELDESEDSVGPQAPTVPQYTPQETAFLNKI